MVWLGFLVLIFLKCKALAILEGGREAIFLSRAVLFLEGILCHDLLLEHLDFLSVRSYVSWGWKALRFLLKLLQTMSGLGTGLQPKPMLLPAV